MIKKENVRILMESIKWNLAVGKMVGSISKDAEEGMLNQIRTLAWVLGDDKIAFLFPDHYSEQGSHASHTKNAQGAYMAINIEMELRRMKEEERDA